MKKIGVNEGLIEYLVGEFTLLSSKISRIDMHTINYALLIDVYIDLLYSKNEKILKLTFTGIEECSLYYKSSYDFYNIERYKFFKSNNYYYISFDPYDEIEEISSDDQNFILSRNVEGYLFASKEEIVN